MPRKNVIRSLKINEISGVDNPAQEGARVSIMKRNEPQQKSLFGPSGDVQKYYGDLADLLTSETDGHQHGINVERRDNGTSFHVSYAKGLEDESQPRSPHRSQRSRAVRAWQSFGPYAHHRSRSNGQRNTRACDERQRRFDHAGE